jgi:hypothetical protein
MKKKNNLRTQMYAIPGGEGLNALPTAFVYTVVIASEDRRRVAMTESK